MMHEPEERQGEHGYIHRVILAAAVYEIWLEWNNKILEQRRRQEAYSGEDHPRSTTESQYVSEDTTVGCSTQ